jgi:hypothetical protein
MIPLCIHGFQTDQCASCRACPHGLPVSKCGRCRSDAVAASRRRVVPRHPANTEADSYHGFEIVFTPDVNGWHYRAPDSSLSPMSYRSAFLARKAVDALGDAPVTEKPRKRRS